MEINAHILPILLVGGDLNPYHVLIHMSLTKVLCYSYCYSRLYSKQTQVKEAQCHPGSNDWK